MTCKEGRGSKNIRDSPNSDMIFLDDMPGTSKFLLREMIQCQYQGGKTEDYKEKESNIAVDNTDSGRKLLSDSKQKTQTEEEDIGLTEFSQAVELKKSSYRIQL